MIALGKDRRYLYPDDDGGRAEIMALLNRRIMEIRDLMPRALNTLVRGNVEVRRLPPEEEPGAPAAYVGAGPIERAQDVRRPRQVRIAGGRIRHQARAALGTQARERLGQTRCATCRQAFAPRC